MREIRTEAALLDSNPGTGFLEMQGFYLKLIFIFFWGGAGGSFRRQVNVYSAHSANSGLWLSAWQLLLQVCGDRITEWMSGGQQSN